jgi:hypothetical protein
VRCSVLEWACIDSCIETTSLFGVTVEDAEGERERDVGVKQSSRPVGTSDLFLRSMASSFGAPHAPNFRSSRASRFKRSHDISRRGRST